MTAEKYGRTAVFRIQVSHPRKFAIKPPEIKGFLTAKIKIKGCIQLSCSCKRMDQFQLITADLADKKHGPGLLKVGFERSHKIMDARLVNIICVDLSAAGICRIVGHTVCQRQIIDYIQSKTIQALVCPKIQHFKYSRLHLRVRPV